MLVRRTGDGRLAKGPFDRERLEEDIYVGLLAQMDRDEVRKLAGLVIEDLEHALPRLAKDLDESELRNNTPYRHCILDSDIREAVEARLRRTDRMQHVQYALSTLGRSDRRGRPGFAGARQVLEWIGHSSNYPRLAIELPPAEVPVAKDVWWSPSEPPVPQTVVKRGTRARQPFDLDRFSHSIEVALAGRPRAERTSMQVARWILWGIAGQRVVLTEQLASGVLDCLRRVDDIAYLRWASIAKHMRSVREFRDEALGLVLQPSPRLEFTADYIRAIRPSPQWWTDTADEDAVDSASDL